MKFKFCYVNSNYGIALLFTVDWTKHFILSWIDKLAIFASFEIYFVGLRNYMYFILSAAVGNFHPVLGSKKFFSKKNVLIYSSLSTDSLVFQSYSHHCSEQILGRLLFNDYDLKRVETQTLSVQASHSRYCLHFYCDKVNSSCPTYDVSDLK